MRRLGLALALVVGCIDVTSSTNLQQTVILVADDQLVVGPAVDLVIATQDSSAALLHYPDTQEELAFSAAEILPLSAAGRRLAIPGVLERLFPAEGVPSTIEAAEWRIAAAPCPITETALVEIPADRSAARWSDSEVAQPMPGPTFEVRTPAGTVGIVATLDPVTALAAAGIRDVVGTTASTRVVVRISHAAGASTSTAGAQDLPMRGDRDADAVHVIGQASPLAPPRAVVWFEERNDSRTAYVLSSTVANNPVTSNVGTIEVGERAALALVGPLELRNLGIDGNSDFTVSMIDAPYFERITAVAHLPGIPRHAGLFAAISGPRSRVIVRADGNSATPVWTPFAVVDTSADIVVLTETGGGLFFAGARGWGFYSRKRGQLCSDAGSLADISNVVALANGTLYVQGVHRETRAPTAAWLSAADVR